MSGPEFSRIYPLDQIGSAWRDVSLSADEGECAALASRFALAAVHQLEAKARIMAEGATIICEGRFSAAVDQLCIATGLPIPVTVEQAIDIRFVPMSVDEGETSEIEISLHDHDIVEHDGRSVDVGEAVAQSLLLALDPFPRSENAEQTLRAAGVVGDDEVVSGAFAGLKSLLQPK